MKEKTVAVVIPTIRNLKFLEAWKNEFKDCIGIIIEDHKKQEISTPSKYFKKTYHYSWEDIDRDFKKNSWIFPRKNAGIRSYGFWKAYELGIDIIITLDDDCYPIKGQEFIKTHLSHLSLQAPVDWYPTYPHTDYLYTRGFPYGARNKSEVVVSHGLWSEVLDFDAPTQLQHLGLKLPYAFDFCEFIPRDYFFPMSSMNLAFKTKITPLMYFPLMGEDQYGKSWGYDRFDDIWAGVFMKKVLDHLGMSVVNGSPFVEHKKASDPFINLKKEAKGIRANEDLYKELKKLIFKSNDMKSNYKEIFKNRHLLKDDLEYEGSLRRAMLIWVNLFK